MHQLHIDLDVVLTGQWHSGTGEGGLLADRHVRRDANNRPYLPASTLRGVVREQCERLARAMGMQDPSDPHGEDGKWFVPANQLGSVVDLLFGTRFVESTLYFRDARIKDTADVLAADQPAVISRTAMSRGLGTVRDSHLFQTEYAEATTLDTSISGWHKNLAIFEEGYLPYAYFFLLLGLHTVERLGGDKSIGKGWCRLELASVTYNGQALDSGQLAEQIRDIAEIWEEYNESEGL